MVETDMKQKTSADYDAGSDSLAIWQVGKKGFGSLEFGDIIVDFDKRKKVVGIELMSATKLLSALSKRSITREMLGQVKECSLSVRETGTMLIVQVKLVLLDEVIDESIPIPLGRSERTVAVAVV